MIDFFHRAKHWMLFIPLALPTLIQYGVQGSLTQKMQQLQMDMIDQPDISMSMPDLSQYAGYWYAYLALVAISYLVVLGWYWSIGYGLRDRLPEGVRQDIGKFRIGMVAASALMVVMMLVLTWGFGFFSELMTSIVNDEPPAFTEDADFPATFLKIWGVAMIGGLLYLASYIYVCIFSAKTLKSIELDKPARGGEVAGYAILLFLPVIGVWLLQPKINRLVETGTMEKEGDGEVW